MPVPHRPNHNRSNYAPRSHNPHDRTEAEHHRADHEDNCTARRRLVRAAALLTLLTLLAVSALTACGGSDDSADTASEDAFATAGAATEEMLDADMSSDSMESFHAEQGRRSIGGDAMADEDMADDDMAMSDDMEEAVEESGSSALATATAVTGDDFNREIIRTAWITVESVDVAAAVAQAQAIIESVGGFVFSQDTRTESPAHTTLTFKVRPSDFDSALDRLSQVGELVDQQVSAQDVTGEVVDLNSRIKTAETSVARLREFLSHATDTEGIAELERELAMRESNLASMRGQLRMLRDRVDLSTITLLITESVETVPTSSASLRLWIADGEDDPCLGGTDHFALPDSTVGFCFEVENNGETALTEVTLRSNELRFGDDDLVVQEGSDLQRIEAGERVAATLVLPVSDGRVAGRVATRGLEINVSLSAVPVTEAGAELARVARKAQLFLYVEEEPEASPGFVDALRGGWNALLAIGNGVLLVFGALLPFLPIIAIALVVAWRWLGRRRTRQAVRDAGASGTASTAAGRKRNIAGDTGKADDPGNDDSTGHGDTGTGDTDTGDTASNNTATDSN